MQFKNKEILFFSATSIVITIVYCQFLFTSSNLVVGGLYYVGNIAKTDNYQSLAAVLTGMQLIHSGHIPFGTFWLPNYYGGAAATFLAVSFIPNVGGTLLLIVSLITNNVIEAWKISVFILLLVTQFFSYKFAKFQFHKTSIAWIFSLAYSFSTSLFSHINNGVIDFVAAAAFMPLALLLFERLSDQPSRKNMAFATASLVFLFFCDLQVTVFSILYIIIRTIYNGLTNPNRQQTTTLLKRQIESVVLFAFSIAPFLIGFSLIQNTSALAVPTIPAYYIVLASSFFLRIIQYTMNEPGSYYIGLTLLLLALLPMFLSRKQGKISSQNFIFYLISLIFFFLIATGTPLSTLVTSLYVRVPSRVQVLINFSLCMCAGYGLLTLSDLLHYKLPKGHLIFRSRHLRTGIVALVAIIIVLDLTAGITPVTTTVPMFTGGDSYIKNQQGTFRVLEYPNVWGYNDYESQLLGHEVIGIGVIALREYPPGSVIFGQLYNRFQSILQQSDVNADQLTALATVCGSKYVLIQTNAENANKFTSFFDNNASQFYAQVYKDQNSIVYENLCFKSMAFAVKDNVKIPDVYNMTMAELNNITLPGATIACNESFNRLDITVNANQSAYAVLSQSYYPYWTVNNGSNTPAFTPFLAVSAFHVDNGTTDETIVFSVANQTLNLYIGFFVPLVLLAIVIYARVKSKKKLFNIALAALLLAGIILAFLGFLGTNIAPSSLKDIANIGIFNKVLLELGSAITLGAILIFASRKLGGFAENTWQNVRKTLQKGSAIKQRGGLLIASIKTKLANQEKLVDNLIKLLLISLLVIATCSNIGLFSDLTDWLNNSVIGVLAIAILLFVVKVFFIDNNSSLTQLSANMLPSSGDIKEKHHIKHLHYGIFAGFIGIFAAGLLMRLITSFSHTVYFSAFILCGALGGLGFGALTSGYSKLRGIIGCGFGVAAIIFGLIMTYSTPIIIGYMIPAATPAMTPIYQWHQYTFIQFAAIQLMSAHGLFYMFFGLVAAYVGGSYLSLRTKPKQMKQSSNLPVTS
jgi:hypothetical protein